MGCCISSTKSPQLKTIEIDKECLLSLREDECNICLEKYVIGETIYFLPCSHHYHYICFSKWIDSQINKKRKMCITCPECRKKYSPRSFSF